jgi:organic hydroperoxide reductase OsmC/OhrA
VTGLALEPKKYGYSTSLKWTGEHKGRLSCDGKPDIGVACPPEWGGHPGIWSPEDLFVASIEVCTLTTFLFLLEKHRGALVSYESTAEGTAQMVDNVFVFKDVTVDVNVLVPTQEDVRKAEMAFSKIADWCLITKMVKCEIKLQPHIDVAQ